MIKERTRSWVSRPLFRKLISTNIGEIVITDSAWAGLYMLELRRRDEKTVYTTIPYSLLKGNRKALRIGKGCFGRIVPWVQFQKLLDCVNLAG